MLTRRRIVAQAGVLGALASVGALAACGTSGGATTEQAAPAGKLKAGSTLVYWNDQAGSYPDLMQKWATAFQTQTGVKVEVTGGIADYANKLPAAFAAGSAPDVFRYLQEQIPIPGAIERGMLLKLDAMAKRDKFDFADFRKDSIELYRWKGVLYGLPRDYGLQVVYYNTELFQKAGLAPIPTDWNDKTWTFQKFADAAVALARTTGGYAHDGAARVAPVGVFCLQQWRGHCEEEL